MSRMSVKEAEERLQSSHDARWRAHNHSNEPPEFFHYCSAQGLKGILESRLFFASDVLSLSDYSEIFHGRDMACELLKKRSSPLAEYLHDAFQRGRRLGGLGETWFGHVVCLCGSKDVLSQWRGYSGTGGFAIGLDPAKLEQRVKQSDFAILKMVYDREEQHRVLAEVIENFEEVFREFAPKSVDEFNPVILKMALILFNTFFYFKHPAFHQENEWRILKINPQEKVQFWLRGADLVPYVPLKFEPDLVKTILHGPGLTSGINDSSIRRLADTLGFAHVNVEKSDIPLR